VIGGARSLHLWEQSEKGQGKLGHILISAIKVCGEIVVLSAPTEKTGDTTHVLLGGRGVWLSLSQEKQPKKHEKKLEGGGGEQMIPCWEHQWEKFFFFFFFGGPKKTGHPKLEAGPCFQKKKKHCGGVWLFCPKGTFWHRAFFFFG